MPVEPRAKLLTVGEIARLEGVPVHRVVYAIEARGIKPTQRLGILRAYDEPQVETIQSALRRIAANRGNGF